MRKCSSRPSFLIFASTSLFDDWARVRCTSRTQTESVPGSSAPASSTRSSPKKCDLPEPRPPWAPLYLAVSSSGRNTRAVGISSVRLVMSIWLDFVHDASLDLCDGQRLLATFELSNGQARMNVRCGSSCGLHSLRWLGVDIAKHHKHIIQRHHTAFVASSLPDFFINQSKSFRFDCVRFSAGPGTKAAALHVVIFDLSFGY